MGAWEIVFLSGTLPLLALAAFALAAAAAIALLASFFVSPPFLDACGDRDSARPSR